MSKIDTGGPAYPWRGFARTVIEDDGSTYVDIDGKTWLDDAAMRIAAAMASGTGLVKKQLSASYVAKQAYLIAQALLAEKRRLEKDE